MVAIAKAIDPAHGRAIPGGHKLAAALGVILRRQLAEILPRLRPGRVPVQAPALGHWTAPMVEALAPLVRPYFVQGGQDAASRLRRLVAQQQRRGFYGNRPNEQRQSALLPGSMHTRNSGRPYGNATGVLDRIRSGVEPGREADIRAGIAGRTGFGNGRLAATGHPGRAGDGRATGHRKEGSVHDVPALAFDLFDPRVKEAINRLTFDFCDATNRTSRLQLQQALAQLRQDLAQGLEEGEVYARLNRRVLGIFADSMRAARIGQTEASRSMHGGQLLSAHQASEETGLTIRKRWLASSDACDACLKLADQVVDLDEDFAVVGTGTYARIPHPPLHPHCMCAMTEVVE